MVKAFQKILLVTEHTPFDTGAENLALTLAQRYERPLDCVLPLVSNPEYEALAPEIAAHAEQAAAVKIMQLRSLARTRGVDLDLRARRGPEPYREIVDEARERGSDLIVIRRRGQRGFLANLLMGEMVFKVVAHAPCSVLIAPRGARMWQRRVLVAAEPTDHGQQLVSHAAAVAAEGALPLHIVSVLAHDEPAQRQKTDAFMTRCRQALLHSGLTVQEQIMAGTPYQEILSAAHHTEADLLVIGSRGDHRIARSLIGGVAQKVIGLAECPVLVVHTPS